MTIISSLFSISLNKSRILVSFTSATPLLLHRSKSPGDRKTTPSPMEEESDDAVQKPVVVDPPLHNEAPPPSPEPAQRRPVVIAADAAVPAAENQLIQRLQRVLVELRELRNQFNVILREIELEVGGDDEQAESSVEDPEDNDSDS